MTIVSFPSTTVQYVRIIQTGSKGNWWSIHEVYAFGNASAVSVSSISLEEQEIGLPVGGTYQAQPQLTPEDAVNKTVFWKSNSPSTAQVGMNGNITGIANGIATIAAISMDGIKKTELRVFVGDGTTGIDEFPGDHNMSLFPNPTSGSVFLNHRAEEATLDILNSLGILVKTITLPSNEEQILLDGFVPGIYLFHLRTSEGDEIKKLIIQ